MSNAGPLLEKSYTFAVKIVKLGRHIQKNQKEFVISAQLIKSGTSVGANIEEASQAQSRPDFISKLSIALKEAHETRFWLRLSRDTGLCLSTDVVQLIQDVEEIVRMLVASIKTAKH